MKSRDESIGNHPGPQNRLKIDFLKFGKQIGFGTSWCALRRRLIIADRSVAGRALLSGIWGPSHTPATPTHAFNAKKFKVRIPLNFFVEVTCGP